MSARAAPPFEDVVFDCDSTLSAIEGIDELARLAGCGEEVAELTRAAMAGESRLEQVYARRLALVRPTRAQVLQLGSAYVAHLVEDAREVVRTLHGRGKRVHLVSGGLRPAVAALAAALDVPARRVQAVDVSFDARGDYAGFDEASPLARGGGKRQVLAAIRASGGPTVFIGDGVTDLEAAGAVELFVGYGGVASRAAVRDGAERVIECRSLAPLLACLLSPAEKFELLQDPRAGMLLAKGEELARDPRSVRRSEAPRT